MRALTGALLVAAALAGAGCAGSHRVEATTVLEYDRCRGLGPGLTRVDFDAVAGIRGGTLLRTPQRPPTAAPAEQPLLVAISRGDQPTPGYAIVLDGAYRRDATAVIEVRWETPPSGAVLAQALTHPCLVVALPKSTFERVEAVDQSGRTLGTLTL